MRVGLVGAGYLGSIHSRLLAARGDSWVGLFDLDQVRAAQVGAEWKKPAFDSLGQLLDEVDGVIVASATSSHYEIAKAALKRGKHLFLEKPITSTVAEAEEIVALAKQKGLVLQVGHVERFNRAVRALGQKAPKPQFIEVHRLSQFRPRGTDVAVVLDLMIHDLDLILTLCKEFPARVEAAGVAVISEGVDIANARMTFPSGAVANVTASRISANPMRKMRLFATDSYISLDFASGRAEIYRLARPGEEKMPGTLALGQIEKGAIQRHILYEAPEAPEGNAIEMEQAEFLRAMSEGIVPTVTGDDGLIALRLATEVLEKIGATETPTGRE
ncbi:MAG: Gfo/Idh/MocA family oxidoreductase [bacterium]